MRYEYIEAAEKIIPGGMNAGDDVFFNSIAPGHHAETNDGAAVMLRLMACPAGTMGYTFSS